CQQGSSNPITF
nr:immunoglobulin light chain junction region [Macaca mulatta]